MLVDAMEVEGLPIDEELSLGDVNRADADWLDIDVSGDLTIHLG